MASAPQKIIDSKDFQIMTRSAKRWSGSCFSAQARATQPDAPFRFGLTASRKVGNAVVRNRCKRRLREVVRGFARLKDQEGQPLSGYDLVLVARTSCADADFKLLQEDLFRACRHLGLVKS